MAEQFTMISGKPPGGYYLSKLKCILIALLVIILVIIVIVLGALLGNAKASKGKSIKTCEGSGSGDNSRDLGHGTTTGPEPITNSDRTCLRFLANSQ